MSTKILTPIWLIQAGDMSADIASEAIPIQFNDNVAIQAVWTGTPEGELNVQVSQDPDNLGWETIVFTNPTPDQPTGSAGSNFYEVNQTGAGYIRLIYTASTGDGELNAKISAKSV